jgi:hypothetical protein
VERKDWETKLDDLEFGLLDPAEDAKLREEIARDPELTRLYELVRSRHQSLQQAAKLSTSPIPLAIPTEAAAPAVKSTRWWRSPLAIAASVLIALVVGEQAWYGVQSSIADERDTSLTLLTPSEKEINSALPFALVAGFPPKSRFPWGMPIKLKYSRRGSTDFELIAEGKIRTDSLGLDSYYVGRDSNATETKVSAQTIFGFAQVASVTKSVEQREVSRVTTDRGVYRPGESLLVRGVTLNNKSLDYDGLDQAARFQVTDAEGRLHWSGESDVADSGVSSHSWPIPADLPEGRYVVSMQPTKDSSATDSRPITIERFATPRLRMRINLPFQSFRAGESVEGSILVEQPTGEPVAHEELTARLVQNDVILSEKKSSTDASGKGGIAVPIPEKLSLGPVKLSVEVTVDGKTESTTQPVPILSREVDLAFFPESGPLVAGIENRVFFQARDVNDEPVRAKGHILDSAGQQIASFEASSTGRGSLTMTPRANEHYSIELVEPVGLLPIRPFPEVSREIAVLRPTSDVFDSDKGFQFDLPSTNPGQRVLLVATCRGSVVGLAAGVLGESASIAVIPSASGVIRVTLYDRIDEPRRPIAERLVFRRPRRQLAIEPTFSTSEKKGLLSVVVKDQATNQPIDGTLLGVSLVDQRFIDRDPKSRPTLASHFLILSAIRSPEDFETTDISLATSAEAERELDMVLATHGWRTFAPLEGQLPDEPKLVVTHSKSVTDPASHREQIEQLHRQHVRVLWGITIAAVLSFVVSSILRKLGAPVYARLLSAVTISFLVLISVPMTYPTERKKSVQEVPGVKRPPQLSETRDLRETGSDPPTTNQAEAEVVAVREEKPRSKEENDVPTAPSVAMRKRAMNEPEQDEASRDRAMDAAVGGAPLDRAPELLAKGASQPASAAIAVPAKPVPALAPEAAAMGRVFSPLRFRQAIEVDNKRPTIIWEPTGITGAEGKMVIGFDLPTEPGPYWLSVDAHTRDGSMGSLRQEVRLP